MRGVVRAGVGGSFVGEHLAEWREGRAVRVPVRLRRPPRYANHGTPDRAFRMQVRGVDLVGSVASALQVEVTGRGSPRQELSGRVRAFVRRSVAAAVGAHDARSAAVVTAVLIGDRAGLDRETTERLQQGGIYHVIAISGGNIAVLTAALLLALRLAGADGRLAALLAVPGLLAYAHVVAPEASVTRAVFAAVVFLAARAADQRTDPLNTLALAAGCLAAADPRSLVDPGFQLTFGATAGLLVGVPRLMAWAAADAARSAAVRFLLLPAAGLLAATICAELALFPIGALHFSRVTVAGLGLNFAAIPLMSAAQLAGMAVVVLTPVSPAAAGAAGWIAHAAAAGIVESTRVLAWAPWLSWRLPAPGPGVVALYYAGWLLWLAADRGRPARWFGAALAGTAAAAMLAAPLPGTGSKAADACGRTPGRGAGAAGALPRRRPGRRHAGALPGRPGAAGGRGGAGARPGGRRRPGWSCPPSGRSACGGSTTWRSRTATRTTSAAPGRCCATCGRGRCGRASRSRRPGRWRSCAPGRARPARSGARSAPATSARSGACGCACCIRPGRTGSARGCATTTPSCWNCATAACPSSCPATSKRAWKGRSRRP